MQNCKKLNIEIEYLRNCIGLLTQNYQQKLQQMEQKLSKMEQKLSKKVKENQKSENQKSENQENQKSENQESEKTEYEINPKLLIDYSMEYIATHKRQGLVYTTEEEFMKLPVKQQKKCWELFNEQELEALEEDGYAPSWKL